jgi:S-DNA-T family DNA segregation ATPase FtsK/SpoIIIE
LFSSLPVEELPPVPPPIDDAVDASGAVEPRLDAPGQTNLFEDGVTLAVGGRHPATDDPLFAASVEAALERGSASLVLLKRRLGVGYARAAGLMEALVAEGVLGEMTASGSRPTLITATEWARRRRA